MIIKKVLILSFYFLIAQCSFGQSAVYPSNGTIYDEKLHQLDIIISTDSLSSLLDPDNRWTNHSYPSTFIYDKKDTIKNIGIRLKGNTSRNAKKQSFKIELDAFQKSSYQGLKTFNLNGDHNDASLCREFLSAYVMNKAGNACLRAGFVKLFINETYYGLYTNSEVVNKTFVKSRFGNDNGNLYKCSWPADLVWIDNNQNTYKSIINKSPLNERAYELKTNETADNYLDLLALITTINKTSTANFKAAIDTIFNVQSYLKILATEVLIGHWDNFFLNKNNYHLYFNTVTKKFEYTPYDMDNTFGVQWGIPNINNRNIHDWGNKSNSKAPLTYKLFEVPEYKRDYENYLRTLVDLVFNDKKLFPLIDGLKITLKEAIQTDPYYSGVFESDYGYTYTDWQSSFDNKIDNHNSFGIKPFISERSLSAKNQFIFKDQIGIKSITTLARVYPNPFKDYFHIQFDFNVGQLQVIALTGEIIIDMELSQGDNLIYTQDLKSGLYLIKISANGRIATGKLLKE